MESSKNYDLEALEFYRKFQLVKFLGKGAFGHVWQAENKQTLLPVAVKFSTDHRSASEEIKIYQLLKPVTTSPIPLIYGNGHIFGFTWLAMDLLGPSLEAVHQKYRRFTKTTMLILGIKMVECLESLHSAQIVHGDIKPDNFAISANDPSKIVIFDFGMARKFDCKIADFHGSLVFASIATHDYQPVQSKDDIESLGYLLADLHKALPWRKANWPVDIYEQIKYGREQKKNKNLFEMTTNFFELTLFLMHVDAHSKPSTKLLKSIFRYTSQKEKK